MKVDATNMDKGPICTRVLIASNTLPLIITKKQDADTFNVSVTREPFPIEAALDGLLGKEIKEYLWIGWPHCEVQDGEVEEVTKAIKKEGSHFHPIFLDNVSINNYYKGYCKMGLWSLLHYQLNFVRLETEWWDSYVLVNQKFCDRIAELYQPGDFIWIHDYHLMLLPLMLKKVLPKEVSIGFFFHAPFPSYELFRILPNRKEMLKGILGSNLIGFQSFEYLRHFRSSCARLLDLESEPTGIEVVGDNMSHFVNLQVYPIGVDFCDFLKNLDMDHVLKRVAKLREIFKGKQVICARDRLDSIEGVPRKLQVIENLLTDFPEWREKLVFIQIYEPTVEEDNESEEQKILHKSVNEMVGRINGKFGTLNFNPIEYINKKVDYEELSALYKLADIALITPVRDGMNLTSHEYVVCQKDTHGVLILSEFTGAARCLGGAIIVNPFSKKEITEAIIDALAMSPELKKLKHEINYNYVMANTAHFWAKRFLYDLYEIAQEDTNNASALHVDVDQLLTRYKESTGKRMFFLDYDGTLTPLVRHPRLAAPSPGLLETLEKLSKDPRNEIYVISGRDRASLEGWLGKLPVGLSCEHGGLFRPPGGADQQWVENPKVDMSWRATVLTIMQDFEDRTPGSFVEHKQINLTWHYRNADVDFSEFQARELQAQLHSVASKFPLDVLVGKKAIEVKPIGINKGSIIRMILDKSSTVDFILCIGDDKTENRIFPEFLANGDWKYYTENGFWNIDLYTPGCPGYMLNFTNGEACPCARPEYRFNGTTSCGIEANKFINPDLMLVNHYRWSNVTLYHDIDATTSIKVPHSLVEYGIHYYSGLVLGNYRFVFEGEYVGQDNPSCPPRQYNINTYDYFAHVVFTPPVPTCDEPVVEVSFMNAEPYHHFSLDDKSPVAIHAGARQRSGPHSGRFYSGPNTSTLFNSDCDKWIVVPPVYDPNNNDCYPL
eukprot:gene15640-18582_t